VAANSVRILNLTNSGFDVEFTAYSTPRDLSTVTFTFAVAADTDIVGSATFPVDIRTVAGDWYAGNQSLQYGSLLRMRTRFSLEGSADALQSVTVTLANSAGQSAAVTGGR
jgi:hypothetical protein